MDILVDFTLLLTREMEDKEGFLQGPLSKEELDKIESTNLSILERHHLRLLAHCLASFKQMADGTFTGSLPTEQQRLQWCLQQPSLRDQRSFISILLEQLAAAGSQLESMAEKCGRSPLELTTEDLIHASRRNQGMNSPVSDDT